MLNNTLVWERKLTVIQIFPGLVDSVGRITLVDCGLRSDTHAEPLWSELEYTLCWSWKYSKLAVYSHVNGWCENDHTIKYMRSTRASFTS